MAKAKSKKKTVAALNKNGKHVNKFMQEVERTFAGLELVEAEGDLKLLLRAEDIAAGYAAQAPDLHNVLRFSTCAIAQACKSHLGADQIAIHKSRAIVEHAGEDGVVRAYRYIVAGAAKTVVTKFDHEELPIKDVMITLKAPLPHQTLEAQREYDVRKRAEKNAGTYAPNPAASNRARKAHTAPKAVLDVRHGGGHIQQTIAPKAVAAA